ncbi:MAG: hypothetical protein LBS19_04325 [Clostridiales bacterium]|jgi:hypothetical protein|nr:hypothetical protein [Clostridiales bacterium]
MELYALLREQFDRVVYVAQKELDVRFSHNFIRKALQQFVNSYGHLYPWASVSNLPWVFCYLGIFRQNLYRQRVRLGSPLYLAILENCPAADFLFEGGSGYARLESKEDMYLPRLTFRFTGHEQIARYGEELRETMDMYVDREDKGVIFHRRLEISELFFANLIRNDGNDRYRNSELLKISGEVMPPL